ncbi:MAG: hypothetical protein IPJ37_15040 [Bacteroidales bacterium]|nr:hypothetical protein [Bacteroidales bacterium]
MISKDTILAGLMQIDYFGKDDEEKIKHYLQVNYFNGYWSNFYFNIVLCRDDQSLSVGPANEVVENCFGFFNERIRLDGHKITGTGFYFVDNQGGRSFYLGRLYYRTSAAVLNGLFIELYSDINFSIPDTRIASR